MKIFKSRSIFLMILISLLLIVAACTNDDTDSTGGNDSSNTGGNETETPDTDEEVIDEVNEVDGWDEDGDPVVVKVMYPWEGSFEEAVLDIVEGELPKNISLELIAIPAELEPLQEMNAAGIVPDVILAQFGLDPIYELDMLEPLDDYIEKYGVDLDEFDESVIMRYRAEDPAGEGRLVGLPTLIDTVGLIYNKEVFDAFGEPYPDHEVPMTWDEVVALTARLTGEQNGTKYRGFDLSTVISTLPFTQFGVNLTDPDTGEVLIRDSEEVRRFVELVDSFYSIPGIYDPETGLGSFGERTTAMTASWPAYFRWGLGGVTENLDMFDVAPVPVWDAGGRGPMKDSHPYVLNKHGENKDAGFQVILTISSVLNRNPLESPHSEFSHSHENQYIYDGKNMEAFWSYEGALPPERISKWDAYVRLGQHLPMLADGTDINEYLRITHEESVIKIEDAIAAE